MQGIRLEDQHGDSDAVFSNENASYNNNNAYNSNNNPIENVSHIFKTKATGKCNTGIKVFWFKVFWPK